MDIDEILRRIKTLETIAASFLNAATFSLPPSKARNRWGLSLISENNWPTRSGRRRELSAIRIRDDFSSGASRGRVARMQARCSTSFSKREAKGRVGKNGVEIHFLNGGCSALYM